MVYLNTSKPCMGCIGYMVYGWHSGWLSPMRAREQFNVAVIGIYLAYDINPDIPYILN